MAIEFFDFENVYAVFSKSNYATKRHSHYALEIVCCREGTFTVTSDRKKHDNLRSVIIPPNLPHSFSCINATCNLLFLDPLSALGSYFMQRYHLASHKDVVSDVSESGLFHKEGEFDIAQLLSSAKKNAFGDLDERVINCIKAIETLFIDQNIKLSELSDVSFLSEGRLSHLFKEQLGISVHQYILWKRIILAVSKSRKGASLTECAYAVGFADSSHFSKAFVKMFGIKPFFVLKS
ncbi:MAG TPA: AraC family transcriptional regulator [Mucilaginibacter sp.]|jgi:AraC-like DNA-binding protein